MKEVVSVLMMSPSLGNFACTRTPSITCLLGRGLRVGLEGSGFGVGGWGSGFRVQGFGFEASNFWLRGLGFGVWGFGV